MSSYICDPIVCVDPDAPHSGMGNGSGHCWHMSLFRRLHGLYGLSRASACLDRLDERQEADIAAWNRLGEKR